MQLTIHKPYDCYFDLFQTGYCFNAQVQEAYLINVDQKEVVKALSIDTINDTTAVKQRFHVDYFHPHSKIWSSYQEDRQTMVCFIDCVLSSINCRCIDNFIIDRR